MKITIDAESLVSGVQFVTKSFDAKNDKAFIALVVNDGEGYLSHENATSLMKAPVKVVEVSYGKGESEEEVRFALNGVFLQKLASVLSGVKGEVKLSKKLSDVTSPLRVTSPTGSFTIPVFDSKIPDLKEFDSLGYVNNFEYFDGLSRLSKICDTKHAAAVPLLSSITLDFDVQEETLTMMATDRYALGEIIVGFTGVDKEGWLEDNSPIFVPVEFATLVPASRDGGTVNLIREPASKKYGYAFDDGRVALFSLKSVSQAFMYGDQKKAAIDSITTSFRAPMAALKKALAAVSSLAWDEPNVYLNIDEDGEVTATDAHQQNVVRVPVEGFTSENNENLRIVFVREVINEALSPISTEETFCGVRSSNAPVSFRNVNDNGEAGEDAFSLAVPAVSRN